MRGKRHRRDDDEAEEVGGGGATFTRQERGEEACREGGREGEGRGSGAVGGGKGAAAGSQGGMMAAGENRAEDFVGVLESWVREQTGKVCGSDGGSGVAAVASEQGGSRVEYRVLRIAAAEEKKMGFFHTAVNSRVTVLVVGEEGERMESFESNWSRSKEHACQRAARAALLALAPHCLSQKALAKAHRYAKRKRAKSRLI